MKLLLTNLMVNLNDGQQELGRLISKKLKLSKNDIKNIKIVKQSIDARKKPGIRLVYSVSCEVNGKFSLPADGDIKVLGEKKREPLIPGEKKLEGRPVVVGTGPAGIFCALVLAQNGYAPVVIERGGNVHDRTRKVETYWNCGELDPDTNVQFGEGGAGTFSDGKLTTRINDPRCEKVLAEYHQFGAPEEILYKAKPHIGTDHLKNVIANMRREIERLGGTVLFNTKMTDIKVRNGAVNGILTGPEGEIAANVVVLAVGHSARDTFEMLYQKGVPFLQKAFSIGVRIEHPQPLIDRAQYGAAAGHPMLGAADYQLFQKLGSRTAYSFCMCPGGVVVASASERHMIVTNGMSEFKRDRENANSALVVSVGPEDFNGTHPLAGIEFQRRWEKLAYAAGGANGNAPVQRLGDFIGGRVGGIGSVKPSYTGETQCSDLNRCLPGDVANAMKEAIPWFDRKINGFGMPDAMLTGVETRTSSPVRIPRNENCECVNIPGLYPAGEGAGYAGGIVSAAVDGIRIAEQIIKKYGTPRL